MKLTLRPATNEDRPAIETLVFTVLREHGLAPDPADTDADLHDIEHAYVKPGGCFDVLINTPGEILGTIGVFPTSKNVCEIRKMYLHPSARGQGYGRQLLDHALTRARLLGFHRITLETANVLKNAIALYERYGFKEYIPTHKSCRCDRAYYLELGADS